MKNYYDEGIIPKYRKRSKKKTPKKSNHKHIYEDVLMKYTIEGVDKYYSGTECSICSKIGEIKYLETEREGRYHRALSQEEILEKYKDLKIVGKKSLFDF